jgi:hypothetical protein
LHRQGAERQEEQISISSKQIVYNWQVKKVIGFDAMWIKTNSEYLESDFTRSCKKALADSAE